ncbi:hypothetical protein DV515_00015112 [Chloebia gouldiae]|uniref:Uncharacterized protein n=1 Tax=Chloebia gouldiae TaxID=44316 RepID=A0A3L8RXE8_CHLGU|nr:hypothetical protein DV515_00015112 [Chloebia gouldiae]
MALTGQPEALRVGMWGSNRQGGENQAGITNLAPCSLASNPTQVPELGKLCNISDHITHPWGPKHAGGSGVEPVRPPEPSAVPCHPRPARLATRVAYDHFLVEAVRQAVRLHGVPRACNGTARAQRRHNGRTAAGHRHRAAHRSGLGAGPGGTERGWGDSGERAGPHPRFQPAPAQAQAQPQPQPRGGRSAPALPRPRSHRSGSSPRPGRRNRPRPRRAPRSRLRHLAATPARAGGGGAPPRHALKGAVAPVPPPRLPTGPSCRQRLGLAPPTPLPAHRPISPAARGTHGSLACPPRPCPRLRPLVPVTGWALSHNPVSAPTVIPRCPSPTASCPQLLPLPPKQIPVTVSAPSYPPQQIPVTASAPSYPPSRSQLPPSLVPPPHPLPLLPVSPAGHWILFSRPTAGPQSLPAPLSPQGWAGGFPCDTHTPMGLVPFQSLKDRDLPPPAGAASPDLWKEPFGGTARWEEDKRWGEIAGCEEAAEWGKAEADKEWKQEHGVSSAGWEWLQKAAPWRLERRKDRQQEALSKGLENYGKINAWLPAVWDEGSCAGDRLLNPAGLREGQDPQSCLRMGTRADGHWGVPWHLSGCQAGISRGWQPLGSSKRSFPPVWDGAWRDGREFWVLCWLQESGCDEVVGLLKDISGCLCPPLWGHFPLHTAPWVVSFQDPSSSVEQGSQDGLGDRIGRDLKDHFIPIPCQGQGTSRGDPGHSHHDPAGHSCGWGHSERAPGTEPNTQPKFRYMAAGNHWDFNVLSNTAVLGAPKALTVLPMTTVLSLLHQLLPPDNNGLGTRSHPGSTSQGTGRDTSLLPAGITLLPELSFWKPGAAPGIFTGVGAEQGKRWRGIFLDALCAQRAKAGCGLTAISCWACLESWSRAEDSGTRLTRWDGAALQTEDPKMSLDLDTPARLAATWTSSGARVADPPKGRGHIVCGVTFSPTTAEEVREKSGEEVTGRVTGDSIVPPASPRPLSSKDFKIQGSPKRGTPSTRPNLVQPGLGHFQAWLKPSPRSGILKTWEKRSSGHGKCRDNSHRSAQAGTHHVPDRVTSSSSSWWQKEGTFLSQSSSQIVLCLRPTASAGGVTQDGRGAGMRSAGTEDAEPRLCMCHKQAATAAPPWLGVGLCPMWVLSPHGQDEQPALKGSSVVWIHASQRCQGGVCGHRRGLSPWRDTEAEVVEAAQRLGTGAAEPGGRSLTATEPLLHPGSPHEGQDLSSAGPGCCATLCSPACGNDLMPETVGKWECPLEWGILISLAWLESGKGMGTMLCVGGNAQEEKKRFIVQDSVRGHEENGNALAMAVSPQGPAGTQTCQLPLCTETRARSKLPLSFTFGQMGVTCDVTTWSPVQRDRSPQRGRAESLEVSQAVSQQGRLWWDNSHGIIPTEECVHGSELGSMEMDWEGFQGLHSSGENWQVTEGWRGARLISSSKGVVGKAFRSEDDVVEMEKEVMGPPQREIPNGSFLGRRETQESSGAPFPPSPRCWDPRVGVCAPLPPHTLLSTSTLLPPIARAQCPKIHGKEGARGARGWHACGLAASLSSAPACPAAASGIPVLLSAASSAETAPGRFFSAIGTGGGRQKQLAPSRGRQAGSGGPGPEDARRGPQPRGCGVARRQVKVKVKDRRPRYRRSGAGGQAGGTLSVPGSGAGEWECGRRAPGKGAGSARGSRGGGSRLGSAGGRCGSSRRLGPPPARLPRLPACCCRYRYRTEGCGAAARRGRMPSHPPARASRGCRPPQSPGQAGAPVPLGSRLQGTGERRSPGPAGLRGRCRRRCPWDASCRGRAGQRRPWETARIHLRPLLSSVRPRTAPDLAERGLSPGQPPPAGSCPLPSGGWGGWAQDGGERRGFDLPSPCS